jgi:pimeloyl-ACP methyl ester carboxylesterase
MAAVARILAPAGGVLEPLQTASSMKGQLDELKEVLVEHGEPPVILIGFSWGAWLSYLIAAFSGHLVRKLILVGSGVFLEQYADSIQQTRLKRLSRDEQGEVTALMEVLSDPGAQAGSEAFKRFGELMFKSDAYDPIEGESEAIDYRVDIFQKIWKEAAALRESGRLLELGRRIRCPVVAIHGDYDPHLAEGVEKPLSAVLSDFRFVLLRKCGHKPWKERHAREPFFRILNEELRKRQENNRGNDPVRGR